ncbi:DUF2024 family protein [Chitinophaga silvisoli]|jgi:hypothetical protein|uniref:DUF2024 family protein n=1 Tax=Chitinophaga silvisoli TaxID=2291814 RepID=A0A3E1P578_9BACT|nr:DUF2024 family protein [Chitinophaga silvisoli]RFM35353.1 DUF2024 family protein [Chitinophaga silvisoli]
MEVAIFDTYVKRREGGYMHFDIIVSADTNYESVLTFGNAYLKSRSLTAPIISSRDCRFCHMQETVPSWEKNIQQQGYHIYELEGCR